MKGPFLALGARKGPFMTFNERNGPLILGVGNGG